MIFELVAFVIAFPLCLLFAKLVRYWDFDVNEKTMFTLFSKYWDGQPQHEMHAWIKVYEFLESKYAHPKELAYVAIKVNDLKLMNSKVITIHSVPKSDLKKSFYS